MAFLFAPAVGVPSSVARDLRALEATLLSLERRTQCYSGNLDALDDATCDAHPRWTAALDAMRDRLRDEFAVTELFVSKHRTAAPAPTLVGMD